MPARPGTARQGFSMLELAVVVAILALLAGLLLNRLQYYEEQAERTSVNQTLNILGAAMRVQMGDRLLHERERPMAQLVGDNPMNWLDKRPGNYVGEYDNPKPGEIAAGSWYFDRHDHALVYLPVYREHLQIAAEESSGLRYRVRLSMANSVGFAPTGGQEFSQSRFQGVLLEPVTSYKWF